MRLVAARRTPLMEDEAMTALAEGYRRFSGKMPSPETLAIFFAQTALETGRWRSMFCNNWGNIKVPTDWDGDYCQFRCNEVINGKVQWFDPPHRQTWFVAFPSAAEGALFYLEFLGSRDRYRKAWNTAVDGAVDAYVVSLYAAGYFTADLASYRAAVGSIYAKALPKAQALLEGKTPLFSADERTQIDGLIAMVSVGQLEEFPLV